MFSGEDSRTEKSREPAEPQHPDFEHEALLSRRKLVNVVLIDDRLHHCTIVMRYRMRTREKLSLTDSAENRAFVIRLNENKGGAENHDSSLPETRLNEQTNKQTI